MEKGEDLMEPTGDHERDRLRKLQEDVRRHGERQTGLVGGLEELVSSLERENGRLTAEVSVLREQLEERDARLAAAAEERRRLASECLEAERERARLASLYVSTLRLHASLERSRVLAAIEEVVGAVVGCEQFAVYSLDRERGSLVRIAASGLAADELTSVPVGSGTLGATAETGELYVSEEAADPDAAAVGPRLSACVPLKVEGAVTGVIALFQLLPHKLGLGEADRELLELLGSEAATALHCADLHARAVRVQR